VIIEGEKKVVSLMKKAGGLKRNPRFVRLQVATITAKWCCCAPFGDRRRDPHKRCDVENVREVAEVVEKLFIERNATRTMYL
jgi:hypothetical protein